MYKANELAIRVATRYVNRIEQEPLLYHWLSPDFAQHSYAKTAAHEISALLRKYENVPPLMVIEEYRDKVNSYSLVNPKNSIMFSVAYDVAEDMIDELIKAYY